MAPRQESLPLEPKGTPIEDGHRGAVRLAVPVQAFELLMSRHPNEPMRGNPTGWLTAENLPHLGPKGRQRGRRGDQGSKGLGRRRQQRLAVSDDDWREGTIPKREHNSMRLRTSSGSDVGREKKHAHRHQGAISRHHHEGSGSDGSNGARKKDRAVRIPPK